MVHVLTAEELEANNGLKSLSGASEQGDIPSLIPVKKDGHLWNKIRTLPSKFIPYKKKSLSYRPLTFSEIERLNQVGMTELDYVELIRPAIDFDVDELSYNDFLWVLLFVTAQTTPNKVWSHNLECPRCKETNTVCFKPLEVDFHDMGVPNLPAYIKVNDKDEIEFDVFRVKDLRTIMEHGKGKDFHKAVLACMIRNIKDYERAYEIVCGIEDIEVGQAILSVEKAMQHGMKKKMAVCNNPDITQILLEDSQKEGDGKPVPCEYQFSYRVDLGVVDLLPFRKLEEIDRNRVRFG